MARKSKPTRDHSKRKSPHKQVKKSGSKPKHKQRRVKKKLHGLKLGQKRVFDDSKPSKTKSTSEKVSILRRFMVVPFKASKKFTKQQIAFIDKHYDGLDGALAIRRLVGLKPHKIDEKQLSLYANAGLVVVKKTYRYRGKTKIGYYVLFGSIKDKAKFSTFKGGFKNIIGERVDIVILFEDELSIYQFMEFPDEYIDEIMLMYWRVFLPYHHLIPTYKLIFPFGESKFEYDDIDLMKEYLEKNLDEKFFTRIVGISFTYHL